MVHHVIPDHIKTLSRKLRRRSTPTEQKMRSLLRNRKFDGIKWYRQFALAIGTDGIYKRYIADFRSYQLKLVIEIDGGYHAQVEQKEYDRHREEMIETLGIHIVRFTNEVIEDDIASALETIRKYGARSL